jgi:hypothetical protein
VKRVCLIATASGKTRRTLAGELTRFPLPRLRSTREVDELLRAERAA